MNKEYDIPFVCKKCRGKGHTGGYIDSAGSHCNSCYKNTPSNFKYMAK